MPELEHVAYAAIPQPARDVLDEIYTPEGAAMWWNARLKTLDLERPRDVHPRDPQRVMNLLNSLADGNFA